MMHCSLSLLLIFASSFVCAHQHLILIASSGHDSPECLKLNKTPCQTLKYVAENLNPVTNISVMIEVSQTGIKLSTAVNFTGYTNLSLVGEGLSGRVNILCNVSGAGLHFANVFGLSLININLTGCGVPRPVTRFDESAKFTELSALQLTNCRNVSIVSSVFFRSNGTAISILDTYGKVLINNTYMVKSSIKMTSHTLDKIYGGNGLVIEFIPTKSDSFNHSCENYSTIYMINSSFLENRAVAGSVVIANYSHSWKNIGCIGGGGGLCISLGQNSSNISVFVERCTISNNSAMLYGGGSKIQTMDTSHSNYISMKWTNFSYNVARNDKMGGGLELIFYYYAEDTKTLKGIPGNTTVDVLFCRFFNNNALNGGGVNVFTGEVALEDYESAIHFQNCTWTSNSAAFYGAAIHVQPGVWASRSKGHYPDITFTNCIFSRNTIVPNNISPFSFYKIREIGAGAFLSNFIEVQFCGETSFEANNNTALYLTTSVASFCPGSRVMFNSNSGINGGAISLIGRSFIYLNGSSDFTFVGNHARDFGGAIYSQSAESKVHQPCFIYRGLEVCRSNLNFINNTAGLGQGNHIFASSFTSCNIFCPPHSKPLDCIGHFTFHPNNNSTATMPTNFSVNTSHTLQLFPGLPFKMPILVSDSEGNNVSQVSYQATLLHKHPDISVDPAFRYVSANTINIIGKERQSAKLQLDDVSDGVSLIIDIALVDCPPGYILNSESRCECFASQYYGLWNCNPVYLMYGVWMGHFANNNQTTLCTSDCPMGYCINKNTNGQAMQLPTNASLLEDTICSSTRSGTRCGECRPGHSVYYNSPYFNCGKNDHCHLSPLYLLLSTVLPLAILLGILTLFDTNFAGGWNSFIFYSQVVCMLYVRGYGFPTGEMTTLNSAIFVYNFFNLELFNLEPFSFCIWRGANTMDILMVRLSTTCIGLLLVVGMVYILMHPRFFCLFRRLLRRRYSVINSISAFLILCYAQCAKTCFQVLYTSCLFDQTGTCLKEVVFYSGKMTPLHGAHLKYAIIAVVFLMLIIVLPPALLLFYPLFFKVLGYYQLSEGRLATYLWRLMPIQLLDSLQNPLKDNYRFFAGLYFLYRTVPLILYAATKNMIQVYTVTELGLVAMIVVHAAFQPYKKTIHNTIDLLLLFNLVLINGITLYVYTNMMIGIEGAVIWWSTAQLVLLLLPLAVAVVILTIKLVTWINVPRRKTAGYTAINTVFDSFGTREE